MLSWPLLKEIPSRDTWFAAAVGLVGVAVLNFSGAPAGQPLSPDAPLGSHLAIAASLVSAFTSAIALIGLHKLKGVDSRAVVTHFSAVSSALCVVALLVLPVLPTGRASPTAAVNSRQPAENLVAREPGRQGETAGWIPLTMLLGVGISATVGQIFLTKAFAAGSPTRVSVIGLSQTVFAMLFKVVLHQQRYSLLTSLGMSLIIAPTAWVLLRRRDIG